MTAIAHPSSIPAGSPAVRTAPDDPETEPSTKPGYPRRGPACRG